jgi:hypothetical protein
MSLNLTFTVQGYTASGWESLGYTCLWRPPWGGLWDLFVLNHLFTVQVGVPGSLFFIYQQQTGMQVSRCLSVGMG